MSLAADVLTLLNAAFNDNISNGWTDINTIISTYGLFLRKNNDVLEISIIEKRGLYKCEDDIFCLRMCKTDDDAHVQYYEFWDRMNYIKRRTDTLENLVPIMIRAIEKISKMHNVLQIHNPHKPALLDSPDLLFTLHKMRQHAIRYNSVTQKISIISSNKIAHEHL